MGKVITVMNMKGGVGKTTVTMHLGGIMARYKINMKPRRVLLIDYDPQFNLSQAFLKPATYFALEKQRKTSLAILQDDGVNLNPYVLSVSGNHNPPKVSEIVHRIYSTSNAHLDIALSTLDLMYIALGQTRSTIKPFEERFAKFITECRSLYDVIFIDCHPAGSILTKTALENSDHVLIPVVSTQYYSNRGIGLMMNFVNASRRSATPHILFNLSARNGVSQQEMKIRTDPQYKSFCFEASLKCYKAFSDPNEGEGFVWTSGKAYSTEAFHNLVNVAQEATTRFDA